MSGNFKPFVPRHPDGIVRGILIGRLSKPNENNDNEAIAASIEAAERSVRARYDGPVEFMRLGEQISGMVYERDTIIEAKRLMGNGWADFAAGEDIGRIFRNPRDIFAFPQECLDLGVRFLAFADAIDTAEPDWMLKAAIAAVRHGFAVPDAESRVRRSATFSFKNGGMVQKNTFAYKKLTRDEAQSGQFGPVGLRLMKDTDWEDIVRLMVAWFLRGAQYAWIADKLNELGVPPGPYVKSGRWNARVVADFLKSELLGGHRKFPDTLHERIYKTGKHKRKRNPTPERTHYPELAFLKPKTYQRLRSEIEKRTRHSKSGAEHPLHGKPRSKSIFPAQHARCGICAALMYAYDRNQLKCSRSDIECTPRCWNHVQVDGELARKRIVAWLMDELCRQPSFREKLVDVAWPEFERLVVHSSRSHASIDVRIATLENESARLANAIRVGGDIPSLVTLLQDVNDRLDAARCEREDQHRQDHQRSRFNSREDVREHLDEAIDHLAATSHDFADFLRSLITRFDIVPVQALDSGLVRPRAYLTLSVMLGDDMTPTHFHGKIDLFDPPKHILHFNKCRMAKLGNPDLTFKELGVLLGLNYMTVKRANNYAKLMEAMLLVEPYRELREPPEKASRWRMSG